MMRQNASALAVFLCLTELCLLSSPCRDEVPFEEIHGRAIGTRFCVKLGDRPATSSLDTLLGPAQK